MNLNHDLGGQFLSQNSTTQTGLNSQFISAETHCLYCGYINIINRSLRRKLRMEEIHPGWIFKNNRIVYK